MSELVLVIRKPLHDFDMQGWCEMLFDSPFLRGLTPDQLTELMLTLASEVGTFDLLENLADTYVAIEHSTPVPTAQEMWDRIQALYQGKYFMYPSFEGGFRALNEAAAEMGLTIDEEQGNA